MEKNLKIFDMLHKIIATLKLFCPNLVEKILPFRSETRLTYTAWCFSTRMKGFQDVFHKSVTNHSIHFHFLSNWLAIDILWKSDENKQKSKGCQI